MARDGLYDMKLAGIRSRATLLDSSSTLIDCSGEASVLISVYPWFGIEGVTAPAAALRLGWYFAFPTWGSRTQAATCHRYRAIHV